MKTETLFEKLNSEQAKAVRAIEGPVLVFAGAGTGKTRVITHRIAYMIESGINPSNIAAMTFTNKAANEMRERLFTMINPKDAKKVSIGTFHSYCARLLRKDIALLGWTADFTIADESDQISIVKQAIAELGYKDQINPLDCIRVISSCKSKLKSASELRDESDFYFDKRVADVYEKYDSLLFMQNMLDFDDLLLLTVRLFEGFPERLENYRSIHRYLLVDEYQDTNFLQFTLIKMLAGDTMNICVVGDDDQSIYGWRGAEVENILSFPKHFPGARIFKLEQNYRSTKVILDSANAVISRNSDRHPKSLWSECGEGEKIVLTSADDEYSESASVAENIENIKLHHRDISYNDIAILYRSNYQSRVLEEVLRDAQIPYRVVGARSFYERREVRDAAAYLRLLINPKDDQSFSRIVASPPRGLGSKAIDILRVEKQKTGRSFCESIQDPQVCAEFGAKGEKSALELGEIILKWREKIKEPGKLACKAETYLREIGYIDGLLRMYKDREEALKRQDNVYELINAIAIFEKNAPSDQATLLNFIERYSLSDDNDKVEDKSENKPAVTLMTVHAAKGLEFKIVFIVGVENGIFPHERSLEEKGLPEETRLFYVALTRAKKQLFISYSNFRMKHGDLFHQKPSVFLSYIPRELIEKRDCRRRSSSLARARIANAYKPFRKFKTTETFISYDD